jgi:tRNA threonylcarbamoyladenosine biosynthesis protein TsaE
MRSTLQTRSANDTEAVARRLGVCLPERVIVVFMGPLGSGKTTFVRGLVAASSTDHVSSPTFVYHQRYVANREPRTVLSGTVGGVIDHVDLYRVQADPSLRLRSGIDELLQRVWGWLLIEWPLPDLTYPADVPRLTVTAGDPPGHFRLETEDQSLATRLTQTLEGVR